MQVYVVTVFGCDSSPSSMWVPTTKIFTDKSKAYEYYHMVAPIYPDIDNMSSHIEFEEGEAIIQHGDYAKRPNGAKIEVLQLSLDQK